jgi:hypothetical protein
LVSLQPCNPTVEEVLLTSMRGVVWLLSHSGPE